MEGVPSTFFADLRRWALCAMHYPLSVISQSTTDDMLTARETQISDDPTGPCGSRN